MHDPVFQHFLSRLREGEESAAVELVRRYEPLVRREARLRLTDATLCRLFDSLDICQSVLWSFFVRVGAGQFDLRRPADLACLLLRMTRNKVVGKVRHVRARPADCRRDLGQDMERLRLPQDAPGPLHALAQRDLLGEVLRRLPAEERALADLRSAGRTWAEVSAAVGGTPEARRKQLGRALERVLEQLGLDQGRTLQTEP
jgi:RNA polymerase sigma-70 factor (ECF subfamily)